MQRAGLPELEKPRVLATAIDREDNTASLDLVMSVAAYFELDDGEAWRLRAQTELRPERFKHFWRD